MRAVAPSVRSLPAPHAEPTLRRPIVWSLAASGSSLVAHLALMLILGLIVIPPLVKPPVPTIVATIQERPVIIRLDSPTPIATPQPTNSGSPTVGSPKSNERANSAVFRFAPGAPAFKTIRNVGRSQIRVDAANPYLSGRQTKSFDAGELRGDPLSVVSGIDAAMDRLTQEILNQLARQKVLVVWVFDQSESVQDDRQEITARIKNVYAELGQSGAVKGDALLTAVTAFGAGFANFTPQPTAEAEEVVAAMNAVPVDPSGKEMLCPAITKSLATFRKFAQSGGRKLMVVVVTDESGEHENNVAELEPTIEAAKSLRAPVYFIGREAIFGYPYAHMIWTDPATKLRFWLRIDRGPETPDPEQLQVDGIHRRYDALPSGFGPYEQARLARETGGVFFLLPSPEVNLVGRDARVYASEAVRSYLPDLSSRADYAAERDKRPLRAAVWQVIRDLNPYDPARAELVQVRFWDWPIDRAAFAREAERNVAKARQLIEVYRRAQQQLEAVAKLKPREPSARWRANYELIYAQTLAYQVRLAEYAGYVTAFVASPKPIKNVLGPARPTNAWDGAYVARTLTDADTKPLRERARQLLADVCRDHPGTPWAVRADAELRRGFGMELHEDYEDPRRASVRLPNP